MIWLYLVWKTHSTHCALGLAKNGRNVERIEGKSEYKKRNINAKNHRKMKMSDTNTA